MNNPRCDCGQPSDKHDATGWSCAACRAFIDRVTSAIDAAIAEQRVGRDRVGYTEHQLRESLSNQRRKYAPVIYRIVYEDGKTPVHKYE